MCSDCDSLNLVDCDLFRWPAAHRSRVLTRSPERGGLGRLRSSGEVRLLAGLQVGKPGGEIFRVIRAWFVGAVGSLISCVGAVV